MATTVRHHTAPPPNACRWCGVIKCDHAQRWVPSKGWHPWEAPTPAQRLARMHAQRKARMHARLDEVSAQLDRQRLAKEARQAWRQQTA